MILEIPVDIETKMLKKTNRLPKPIFYEMT